MERVEAPGLTGIPLDWGQAAIETLSIWRPGDTIPFGLRALRVVEVRDGDLDDDPVLVVEDMSG
jgi:hypothetical protein